MLPTRPIQQMQTQTEPLQKALIENFTGGLNTADPETSLKENQFTILSNYLFKDNGTLKARPPYIFWHNTAVKDTKLPSGCTEIIDVKEFDVGENLSTDDRTLFVSYKTSTNISLAYWDDDTTSDWVVVHEATGATELDFIEYEINEANDVLIFTDSDCPYRWSASSPAVAAVEMGLEAPEASEFGTSGVKATSTPGVDLTDDPNVHYKFAYFHDDSNTTTRYGLSSSGNGYTYAASGATGSYQITLTLTGAGARPTTASKIYVYRSPKNTSEGPYRKIGEIDISSWTGTDTVTYVDNTPWDFEGEEDIQEGSNPSEAPILKALYPIRLQSRIAAVDADQKYKLIWTEPGNPDTWNPLSFQYFEGDITGIIDFNGKIYVFTERDIYATTDIATPFVKVSFGGCTARKSLVDIGVGIMWQGTDNVYFADFNSYNVDGNFPIPVFNSVRDKIRSIGNDYRKNSVACLHQDRYYLCFSENGDNKNTTTLVFDTRFKCISQVDWTMNSISSFRDQLVGGRKNIRFNGTDVVTEHYPYILNYDDKWTDYDSHAAYGEDATISIFSNVGDAIFVLDDSLLDSVTDLLAYEFGDLVASGSQYLRLEDGCVIEDEIATIIYSQSTATNLLLEDTEIVIENSAVTNGVYNVIDSADLILQADGNYYGQITIAVPGQADTSGNNGLITTTGGGKEIITSIVSKRIQFGPEQRVFTVSSVSSIIETVGVSVDIGVVVNNSEYTRSKTVVLGDGYTSATEGSLIWGSGLWGTGIWGFGGSKFYSFSRKVARGTKCNNIKLTMNCTNSKDLSLVAFGFAYKLLPPKI